MNWRELAKQVGVEEEAGKQTSSTYQLDYYKL